MLRGWFTVVVMKMTPRLAISLKLRPARFYTHLYMVAMLGLGIAFMTKKFSEWDICFLPTAQHLVAGEDIYVQSHGYVYPPFQSIFAVPVLPLPHLLQRLAWFITNAVCLWLALRSAWRFAGGPDFATMSQREHLACGLGLFIGMTYFLNSLMHHQTDIVLAALVFAGCERIQEGRGIKAASLFGLAAAMKCTPILFAPYLLVRGRIFAALWLVVIAVGVNLLPDTIHSPKDASSWLMKWYSTYLAPMASAEHRPGVWASDIIFNQSIIGAVNRWSMTEWSTNGGFRTHLIVPLLSPKAMKAIVLAAALVLGGISMILMFRKRDMACDCSIVICGMLLFSPMSSPAHFGVLILPAFLLARSPSRLARSCLAVMFLAALASNKDLLGATLYSLGLWHGTVMLAALAALLGMWTFSARLPVRVADGDPAG